MSEMSDLESAIRQKSSTPQDTQPSISSTSNPRDPESDGLTMNVGDFVVGLFTDGYYPGEIMNIDDEYVTVDFLIPAVTKQNHDGSSLWKRPSESYADKHTLHKSSILPIRPVLGINKLSTNRVIIFELLNADLIEKFI